MLDFVVVCFLASWAYYQWTKNASRIPTPPGPRGIPVLGNALQIPNHYTWLTFAHWARKYGKCPTSSGFIRVLSVTVVRRSYYTPFRGWEPNHSAKQPRGDLRPSGEEERNIL